MKGLLLVLVVVALSASLEAAEQFRQVEEGVYVLGTDEALSPAAQELKRLHVQPEGEAGVRLWPGGPRVNKIDSRYNLALGSIGLWDRMLAHYQPQRTAEPDTAVFQEITYRGGNLIKINFIRALQTSGKEATVMVADGGLGKNFVIIWILSPRGEGFQFSIDIWGR